jgi:hypothetical protein
MARDCKLGLRPILPFALKTVRTRRRIKIACELAFHPSTISPPRLTIFRPFKP